MLYVTDFGAVGDGEHLNTEAFRLAVEAAHGRGEAVCVPSGVFLTGTINLRGASLHLEPGAVIKASSDLADYPPQDYVHNELGVLKALIVCLHEQHVSITGQGTIDLSGQAFFDHSRYNVPPTLVPMNGEQVKDCTWFIGKRPSQCIFFHDCRDVTISGITIVDAPCWTISISRCHQVRLTGLTINTDLNTPNDDGIHVTASRGVIISDCHIESGDDCIALSSITDWETPCEDVVINNCVLKSCSKAIVIGYTYSVVRNILISNCIIRESNRGLCFMCHTKAALVENVRVTNMIIETKIRPGNWWGNGEPILLMAVPHVTEKTSGQQPERDTSCAIRNVTIDGAVCAGENAMGIIGTEGNIREITLQNIRYRRRASENLALKGFRFDLSPSADWAEVPGDCALLIRGAQDVCLRDIDAGSLRIDRQ